MNDAHSARTQRVFDLKPAELPRRGLGGTVHADDDRPTVLATVEVCIEGRDSLGRQPTRDEVEDRRVIRARHR